MTWHDLETFALAYYFDSCWQSPEARGRAIARQREREAARVRTPVAELLEFFSTDSEMEKAA